MAKNQKTTDKKKKSKKKHGSLPNCVTRAVEEYFSHLDETEARDFYALLIKQVEAPMLTIVMREAKQNQSIASKMLGLNRGTLRKKLKEHGLL